MKKQNYSAVVYKINKNSILIVSLAIVQITYMEIECHAKKQ